MRPSSSHSVAARRLHGRRAGRLGLGLALLAGLVPASARDEVIAVIARAKPSVVIVGTFRVTDSPRFKLRGTGFVVGDGGWVITNAHVLPGAAEITPDLSVVVQLRRSDNELETRPAQVQDVDMTHDLALLKLGGPPARPLQLGDSEAVKEGQSVLFLGFPIGGVLGYSMVTHRGMVSSITAIAPPKPTSQALDPKTIIALRSGSFDIFQLDATAYPGNSGGPVLDADTGQVLGVINSVLVKSTKESALTNPSGISYAIPAKFVVQLLQRQPKAP